MNVKKACETLANLYETLDGSGTYEFVSLVRNGKTALYIFGADDDTGYLSCPLELVETLIALEESEYCGPGKEQLYDAIAGAAREAGFPETTPRSLTWGRLADEAEGMDEDQQILVCDADGNVHPCHIEYVDGMPYIKMVCQ